MERVLSGATLAGVRVLLAEDHADSREMLVDFLGTCGITVLEAESGDEAFAIFRRERPAIVVSDIAMERPDAGIALIRRVRALAPEDGGLTPAIAVSAHSNAAACLDAGFHVHLMKPIDPAALIDILRDFARADAPTDDAWSLTRLRPGVIHLAWNGHASAAAMTAMTASLAAMLEGEPPCELINDLRKLTGFSPSVGSVGERGAWSVRKKIARVRVVGGPPLAHLVSRAACKMLGIDCEVVDAASCGL